MGDIQEIGKTGIIYEQINIDHSPDLLIYRNIKEVPDYAYRIQKHCHDVIEILYPQTNPISMWLNGKEILIQPKEVFIINPGTVHSPGTPDHITHVDTYIFFIKESAFDFLNKDIVFKENVISHGTIQKSLELMIDAYDDGNEMQVNGSLMYFLGSLERIGYLTETKPIVQKRIIRVLNYIEEHYHDCNLSPYDIASQEHISYSHFSREFKNTLGVSFKSYLTHLRLKHALHDLQYTDFSITDIAMNNGFSDVQALIRVSHKVIKMSPSKYRERFL